ncbi:MAG: methyltransferase domain-containing protein [Acidobacteria bacterium]|nr:methyltransferase domain-containing protein [Acidobacteriota bacterium]
MTAPGHAVQPSPLLFFETMNAHVRTEALKAAIELDVFTAIGEGSHTPAALAERCKAAERGMRILCDYLVVIGFLLKEGSEYRLTPDSAMFLDRRSPTCIAAAVIFLGDSQLVDKFKNLAGAVRKGGTLQADGTLAPEHPIWVEFAKGMAPLTALPAELMAKLVGADKGEKWKVLDIAASHGTFGITFARKNPQTEIYAVDWANVLELAKANARKAGLDGRYHTIPGSAFEVQFGTGYDIVLLTNILHHFDVPACETLMKRVHAALKPGGRALTLEFVPNEDRVSPPQAAAFPLTMLASTPAGDAYTFAEYDRMFRNAGFAASELHAIPPSIQHVIVSTKA